MADLLLRDLLVATGGRLSLAAMPPRDGDLLMLRRSTSHAAGVRSGDLYWALPGSDDNGMHHVEEAFARGAAGAVICGREIEPWPGKFTLAVTDARSALWQAAEHARTRFEGTVVAAAGSGMSDLLHQVLGSQLSGSRCAGSHCSARGSHDRQASDELPLALLNAHPSHNYLVLDCPNTHAADIHRCCPHIAVVTSATSSDEIMPMLQSLPADGWAVLNGDEPLLRNAVAALGDDSLRVIWVGTTAGCDLRAEFSKRCIVIEGTKIPVAQAADVFNVLAAVAVGKILNISDLSMFAVLGKVPPQTASDRTVYAPTDAALLMPSLLSNRAP